MAALDDLSPLFPFLQHLTPPARARVQAHLRAREVAPGTPLLGKGDEAGGVFLVQQGALRVYHLDAAGREGTLYWIEAGDTCILALNCVFAAVPYPAWVESCGDTPARFGVIPGALFRELFQSEPAVQAFAFDALSSRTFQLMGLLGEALSLGLGPRLVRLLLRFSDADGRVKVTQEALAGHLGTAREVVSRLLRSLVARGLIRTGRGTIELVDRAALEAEVTEA